MATTDKDDTNTLYFIVGGLVVLALVFAFIYMGNNNTDLASPQRTAEAPYEENASPDAVSPAAGTPGTGNPETQTPPTGQQ
jgi:hypothetical protein